MQARLPSRCCALGAAPSEVRCSASRVVALAASLALAPRLGTEFLPELNEGSIWVNLMLPAGHLGAETIAPAARTARASLAHRSRSDARSSQGGTAGRRHRSQADQHGGVLRRPEAGAEWRHSSPRTQLLDRDGQARSTAIPGIEPSFSQPIRDNVLESISQIDGQVVMSPPWPWLCSSTGSVGVAWACEDLR